MGGEEKEREIERERERDGWREKGDIQRVTEMLREGSTNLSMCLCLEHNLADGRMSFSVSNCTSANCLSEY